MLLRNVDEKILSNETVMFTQLICEHRNSWTETERNTHTAQYAYDPSALALNIKLPHTIVLDFVFS